MNKELKELNNKAKRKVLYGWNRFYGFMSFEIPICYGETLEEKKKYYEDMGYYCYIRLENDASDDEK